MKREEREKREGDGEKSEMGVKIDEEKKRWIKRAIQKERGKKQEEV